MGLPEPFGFFIEPLEAAEIPYCITGSVASGIYGEPRLTKDIDLVLLIKTSDAPRFRAAFSEEEFYVPPLETFITELSRGQRGCLNLYHHETGFKADLFFVVRDPLHVWAMKNRRRAPYGDAHVWLAPPEYVLLRKLEFFREGEQDKHIRDARHMLKVTEMDRRFIVVNVDRLGLEKQWDELLEAYRATGGESFD